MSYRHLKNPEMVSKTIEKIEYDLKRAKATNDTSTVQKLSHILTDLKNHYTFLLTGECKYATIFKNVLTDAVKD